MTQQAPAQQVQTVTLEVNINQLNTILSGVVKLPIEIGLEVFNLIQQQAQAQLGPMQQPTEPPADSVIQ